MNKIRLEEMVQSIQFVLNPIFDDPQVRAGITARLVEGKLVVIKDAMKEGFAERIFRCLDEFDQWKLFEGYEEDFHYHHHNIYDFEMFPPDLKLCHEIFTSEASKEFIRDLSQMDCEGTGTLSASWYMPGDHSLPHDDATGQKDNYRQVAYVWYLTKNWQTDWGGQLYWCEKSRSVPPAFNKLVLFRVRRHNKHFVTQVSPHARSKRLAISGWWTGRENPAAVPDVPDDATEPQIYFI